MKTLLYKTIAIVLLLGINRIALGQLANDKQPLDDRKAKVLAETNVHKLKEMSRISSEKFKENKAKAVAKAKEMNWPIRETSPDGRVIELMYLDEEGFPVYYTSANATSAEIISTDVLRNDFFGVQGEGMLIGEWDAGNILSTHEQFTGRVTNNDAAPLSQHSTHVCGTLIGNGTGNAAAMGMAPMANLTGYDWDDFISEVQDEAADGLLISNHSHGLLIGWGAINITGACNARWSYRNNANLFGQYSSRSRDLDETASDAPYHLMVVCAMNNRSDAPPAGTCHTHLGVAGTFTDAHPADGDTGGFDSTDPTATGKNILTVGAVQSDGITMTNFSGWGPTDDGRIKPDIVADGDNLQSADIGSNSDYTTMSGTSMATPSVAGSALLLQQLYQESHDGNSMRSATLKGLIIHTADDLGNPGPDYSFGWGRMNSTAAAELILNDQVNDYVVQENVLSNRTTFTTTVQSNGDPIIVTLCWIDLAGAAQTGNDITTSNLVNDLDLRVSAGDMPWILNPASRAADATTGDNTQDNVEQIVIENPGVGTLTITVSHKGSLSGSRQHFSLIVSGGVCPISQVVSHPINSGKVLYTASSYLIGESRIDHNSRVEFRAGDYIRLVVGFESVAGSYFDGSIGACIENNFANPSSSAAKMGYYESNTTEVSELQEQIPIDLSVSPNPFSSNFEVTVTMNQDEDVRMTLYNSLGARIKNLMESKVSRGTGKFTFDGSDLVPGVYLVEINYGASKMVKRIVKM